MKNKDPQADSVKPEPSDIIMDTIPTQRKFNLTKTKGRGQRQKRKRKPYSSGKHINKLRQRCYHQSNTKSRKLVPFGPFTKYGQLDVIHLTKDKLETVISAICIIT